MLWKSIYPKVKTVCVCLLAAVITSFILFSHSTRLFLNQKRSIYHRPMYMVENMAHDICKTYNYDPVEWTLYWKSPYNAIMENKTCRELHDSIFKHKLAKRIIYPNKTIRNLGCTKHTHSCSQGAHFDTKRNIRINTTPCCIAILLEMLEIITKGFQRLKIPHMLCGGAVLGWARNKQMVPYDNDLDMLINGSFWRTPAMLTFLKDLSEKYGFVTHWRSDNESFSIFYSKTNGNGIDFWSYRFKGEKIHVINNVSPDYDYSTISPPRPVKFSGISTYVPNDPQRHNDETYGKGKWERELNCKKTYGRKCIP